MKKTKKLAKTAEETLTTIGLTEDYMKGFKAGVEFALSICPHSKKDTFAPFTTPTTEPGTGTPYTVPYMPWINPQWIGPKSPWQPPYEVTCSTGVSHGVQK